MQYLGILTTESMTDTIVTIAIVFSGTLIVVALIAIMFWCFTRPTRENIAALRLIMRMDNSATDLDEEWLLGAENGVSVLSRPAAIRASAPEESTADKTNPEGPRVGSPDSDGSETFANASATESTYSEVAELAEALESRGIVVPVKYNKRRPARMKDVTKSELLAISLAGECYFKFGRRPKSEANILISRKWMRDRMEEIKDLRKKDAASIIDIALGLSFFPSVEAREMDLLLGTSVSASRMGPLRGSWWARWLGWLGFPGNALGSYQPPPRC